MVEVKQHRISFKPVRPTILVLALIIGGLGGGAIIMGWESALTGCIVALSGIAGSILEVEKLPDG